MGNFDCLMKEVSVNMNSRPQSMTSNILQCNVFYDVRRFDMLHSRSVALAPSQYGKGAVSHGYIRRREALRRRRTAQKEAKINHRRTAQATKNRQSAQGSLNRHHISAQRSSPANVLQRKWNDHGCCQVRTISIFKTSLIINPHDWRPQTRRGFPVFGNIIRYLT